MLDIVDRYPLYSLIFCFLLFPIPAWAILRIGAPKVRMALFACFNVFGLAVLCLLSGAKSIRVSQAGTYLQIAPVFFAIYVAVALFHYVALRRCRRDGTVWPAIAFFFPLVLLAYIKYISDSMSPFGPILEPIGLSHFGIFFIGISYLSFRLVHIVGEVRNQIVEMPTLSEYLSFAFFVPTMSIGPINPYSRFIGSLNHPDRNRTPLGRSALRIVVGFAKYMFLGSLLNQFTYGGLLRDGHPHDKFDLFVAMLAYAAYLYCNFSGFCDIVIGVSGLLNIEVHENFDRPFLARNFQEFWNRWHITLSLWIRDLVFTPFSKILMRRWGMKSANHSIAVAILTSFLLVGIWHGKGWNFVLFGALQGVGLVTVHYYGVWLKKRLGRDGYAAYRKNQGIAVAGQIGTYLYFSMTLFFVANTWSQMSAIWALVR